MEKQYPPVGFHFRVAFGRPDLSGHDVLFQEVSGLSRELSVVSLEEGGENRFTHQLPGRAKYSNLVLKRGLVNDSALTKWFQSAIDELQIEPTSVTVSLLNENHQPLSSWTFVGAWPVKWSISSFDAQKNAIVVDTVELAYQYFTETQL